MCVLRRVADNLQQECLESSQLRWLTVCQVVLLQMDSIWLSIPAGGVSESADRRALTEGPKGCGWGSSSVQWAWWGVSVISCLSCRLSGLWTQRGVCSTRSVAPRLSHTSALQGKRQTVGLCQASAVLFRLRSLPNTGMKVTMLPVTE